MNPTKITLSALYVDLLPESEIRDVVLHEIAHGKAGHKAGHGPIWKAHAKAIGCTAMRCATPSAQPAGKYEGRCAQGHTYQMHRLPQRVKCCTKCRGNYLQRALTIYENGEPVESWRLPQRHFEEFQMLVTRYSR